MADKPTNDTRTADYFARLDHPLADVVQALRNVILSADPEVGEQIKWNSPAYYYTGEMKPFDPKEYKRDIVVFHLRKPDSVLLIFPTGAQIDDPTGLLEGKFTDGRKTASFKSVEEVDTKAGHLRTVIRQWLALVER